MEKFSAYKNIELNDKTLSERVEKTLEQLSTNPTLSISAACDDQHQAKAVYRLLANEKFTADALIEMSQKETIRNISESGKSVVLIPQDTTSLNYSGLKCAEGLGYINDNKCNQGIMLHSAIAVSEEGQPFGLLAQKAWVRPDDEFGKKHKRTQLPIEEKESYKWLETLDKADINDDLDNVHFIHVCDREGDLYEFFAKASLDGVTYICRRVQNRVVITESEETLLINAYLDTLPVAGELVVNVPRDSHTKRAARTATLEVKFGRPSIKRPALLNKVKNLPATVEVILISAVEIDPPAGVEPISWQLVTNDIVETFEDAVTCVNRYTQRWKIETFHSVLKGGCKIEDSQVSTAERLIKLISVYSVIALQIMILTFLARSNPDASCEIAFQEDEWKILYKVAKKTKSIPDKPPTIHEAVIMIAKLGGFLARKSDGFPGVKVIWRGLTTFYSILEAAPFLE
jgi:hypothetical protein